MNTLKAMVRRNVRMFFKDKGLFFTSLITPLILLVLYMTFLSNVYKDSFLLSVPAGFAVEETLVNALAGGQLVSSLLAVCGVTVAFCSNMLMVQDKVTGASRDFGITPLKASVKAVGYYLATFICTLIICLVALGAGFVYLLSVGWYLSVWDVCAVLLDVVLLVLFGTALSSIINMFLSSQGQISAVGTMVSSCYGFLCGAYMPISQFSEGLQAVISFLPGTYATSLLRNHFLNGVLAEMEASGLPADVIGMTRDAMDCNLYIFDTALSTGTMLWLFGGCTLLLVAVYIGLQAIRKK